MWGFFIHRYASSSDSNSDSSSLCDDDIVDNEDTEIVDSEDTIDHGEENAMYSHLPSSTSQGDNEMSTENQLIAKSIM